MVSRGLARVGVSGAAEHRGADEVFYELHLTGAKKKKAKVKIAKIKFMDMLNNLLGKKNKRRANGKFFPLFRLKIYEAGELRLQEILASSALEITYNHIKIGRRWRVLFVMSYPRFLASNWFSPIINLDKVLTFPYSIHP